MIKETRSYDHTPVFLFKFRYSLVTLPRSNNLYAGSHMFLKGLCQTLSPSSTEAGGPLPGVIFSVIERG